MSFSKHTGYNKIKWNLKNVTREALIKYNKNKPLQIYPISIELNDEIRNWRCVAYAENEFLMIAFGVCFDMLKDSPGSFYIEFIVTLNEKKSQKKGALSDYTPGRFLGWNFMSLVELFDQTKNYVSSKNEATIKIQLILTVKEKVNVIYRPINNENSAYFNQSTYSDFTLVCSDDVEIPVHRVYLALQSSVFKTMFDIEMSEQNEKKALINDIDSTIMKEVIYYIYTGQVRSANYSVLIKIIYAAEKYGLNGLKSWCIAELYIKVKNENVLDIFAAAELHNSKMLVDRCLSIIMYEYKNLEAAISKLPVKLIMKIVRAFAESSSVKFESTL